MARLRESSVVNYRALEDDASGERRGELLRNLAALLRHASERGATDLLDIYDSVMLRLSEMVEPGVRAEIAMSLSDLRTAPVALVHRLALDEIEVAQPLILRSTLLSDGDLQGIAEIRGDRHRRIIAQRPGIGEELADRLAERGDDSVRRALAANVTARLGPNTIDRLLLQARCDAEMQLLLAEHPFASPEALSQLMDFAAEHVSNVLALRAVAAGSIGPQGRAMTVAQLFADYDFVAARAKVTRRLRHQPVDMALVAELTTGNAFDEAVVALSRLSRVKLDSILEWFAKCDANSLLVVSKALGAEEEEFAALLNAGPIRFRMSASERSSAHRAFRAMEQDSANLLLVSMREKRGLKAAAREVAATL